MHSLFELCALLKAPKRLVSLRDWKRVNAQLRLAAALEIDGIVPAGLSFEATVAAEYSDENVTLMLHAFIKQKPRPFARIDWLTKAHPNVHRYCGPLRYVDAGRSHFHDTKLHVDIDFDELFLGKLNLPCARALDPDPPDFKELLVISSQLLHIENLQEIQTPPWQPRNFTV